MGTLWPRVKRKKEDEEKEKRRERCREKREAEESKRKRDGGRRERSRALAVHITLLTIRGQCHRVRPAAPLHFTWLHLAPPSRFSPACALRLLVLPPSHRVAPPPSHTRSFLSPHPSDPSRLSLAIHARARSVSCAPRLSSRSLPSSSFHPRPFPLLLYRRLLSRASTSSSPAPPFLLLFRALVLLLLPVPPRPPPPSILIDRSCTRAQRSASSSYRLVSSPSTRSLFSFLFFASFFLSSLFLFACSPSAALSFFVLQLSPPPHPPSLSLSPFYSLFARARAAQYKLFQKFILLLLSLNHSQRRSQRRALESSTMRDSVRAPSTTTSS